MKTKLLLFTLAAILLLSSSAFAEYDTLWTKYTHSITGLEFSKDDSQILTIGDDGIILFDTGTGQELHSIPVIEPDRCFDACYTHDGTKILLSRESFDEVNHLFSYIDVYDAETYELIKTIYLNQIPVKYGATRFSISNDDSKIAVVDDISLSFVDYESGEIIKSIPFTYHGTDTYLGTVSIISFSNDDKYLIMTASNQNFESTRLQFLNTETYEIDYLYSKGKWFLTISDDGSMIAFSSDEEGVAVSIMNVETKEIIGDIPGNSGWIRSICFSPDSKYFAISSLEYRMDIYETASFNLFKTYDNLGRAFKSMDIAQSNDRIIATSGAILILFNFLTSDTENQMNQICTLYPNPSTNIANLEFNIEIPTDIFLSISDINGKEIGTLKYGVFEEGTFTIEYDCSKLPNGVYFLTLSGKDFKKTYQLVKEG
jgi:WD40 repeat protein